MKIVVPVKLTPDLVEERCSLYRGGGRRRPDDQDNGIGGGFR
jgi:hypothetical protein